MSFKLEDYKIGDIPTIYYIPDFISEIEESFLLKDIENSPKTKWTCLKNRRLINFGGIPHQNGMITEDIPKWLQTYTSKIGDLNIFDRKIPNHILLNEYKAGQGIMPHLDGPIFFPTITTINLGSHTVLNFYSPMEEDNNTNSSEVSTIKNWTERLKFSLLLKPRSLLILKGDTYHKYLHGIDEIEIDEITPKIINCADLNVHPGEKLKRDTRISLTIRYVPKCTKKSFLRL